jgi:RNA polymerase sigma-70 factor (ECF subfamily)
LTDKELIRGIEKGDEVAFKKLYDLHAVRIYNTALGIMQNKEQAEDITQEVFIAVIKHIGTFKEQSKLSTWIYRITVSKSIDLLRKDKKWRMGNSDGLLIEKSDYTAEHPGLKLENRELAAALWQAILRLSEKQKVAFVLHKIELLSYKEIAEVMEMTESAVDSLIFRARQNLQKILETDFKP